MKIEIAEHERMSESGSSLLRLIQNQDTPLLDLFVRESVQNSLDAFRADSSSVDVDFQIGEFNCRDLNKHFEKIESRLNQKYSAATGRFISVRDTNTVGLTGPVRYSEVRNNQFGNLLKLVYEICKPQQNEGAGGSWGLGKTIYFRVGIGLVLYYSRIHQNGKYQSRLAACLVEDETKSDALIPSTSSVKRGIAWWGKKDGMGSSSTVPVENEREIEKVLSVFGIEKYSGTETGTTIIIPYIDEEKLLNEVYAKNEPSEQKPYWVNSVDEYLKIAVQRWYAPRLFNSAYPYGPYLSVRINNKRMKVSKMLSTFRCIRELYILACGYELDDESIISSEKVSCEVESIDLRGVLDTTSSGKLAFAKFNRKNLYMEPPVNEKSPYQQILNIAIPMENGNNPIIMYTRRPGMIVGYDYDKQWTHGMPKCNSDEFVIGIFVANSNNTLKNIVDVKTGEKMKLDTYIRQGEKADHASWTDLNINGNNPRIIANIQKNVVKKIKKKYTEATPDPVHRQNIGLGHALADLLLPAEDFGNAATSTGDNGGNGGKGGNGGRNRSGRKSAFHIIGQPRYQNDGVTFDFEMILKTKKCRLALQVITDFKGYEANSWEADDEIGKEFPVRLNKMEITSVQNLPKTRKKPQECNCSVSKNRLSAENESFEMIVKSSDRFGVNSYVEMIPRKSNIQLKGTVSLSFADSSVRGGFNFKEINNE